jgi:hypothetical protein
MWYQFARLITVQIALSLGCFCSVAVATIGYVAAMLLVQIKEEGVGVRVKFQDHLRGVLLIVRKIASFFFFSRSIFTSSISVGTLPDEDVRGSDRIRFWLQLAK